MKKNFKKIDLATLNKNVFTLIGTDWMLLTAGTHDSYNMMTASWGGLGVLWNKNVCFCFVRPSRYTYEFMEKNDTFTLSFFPEKHHDLLMACGTRTGKTVNKMQLPGLTPIESEHKTVHFAEANLVLICKKLYTHDIDKEKFMDSTLSSVYPEGDYHRMYIGEIVECFTK